MPFFSGKCQSKIRLEGKTALITGCNTGIGKETVPTGLLQKRLFYVLFVSGFADSADGFVADLWCVSGPTELFMDIGAKVIMACRSLEKAEQAKADIEKKCKDLPGTGSIVLAKLDLTSLKSVREFAQSVLDTEPHINILVNNAGVMMCPKSETEDGFEMQIGTNHLAHFLLTMLLLPRIRNSTPARIVTVSSLGHRANGIFLDDLNYKKRPYKPMEAYAQSKSANILFSRELAAKLKEHNIEGINTYSLHPGAIQTELGRHLNDTLFKGASSVQRLIGPFLKTPEQGAQTTIYCAVDEKCANETGLYYSDCVVTKTSSTVKKDSDAKKLWELSSELVGL